MPWPPAGWRTSKSPPWKVPVWVAPPGRAARSFTLPARVSTMEPSGIEASEESAAAWVAPGTRTSTLPFAGAIATLASRTGGRGGRGRELRPRQRRRRGGGRQGRCRTLPRRGERRKRHVVAVRDATVVGGHEAQVVCRPGREGPDAGGDGDRLVALARARRVGRGAVGERRAVLEPVRGLPGARVDEAVQRRRCGGDRGGCLRLDVGGHLGGGGGSGAGDGRSQREEDGKGGVTRAGGHRVSRACAPGSSCRR